MQKKLTAQQRTELLDHVSACQSAYHIDSTPGHRFGGLPSNLPENRDAVVDFVEELLAPRAQVFQPSYPQGQAPKVTIEDVNAEIVGETYTVLPSGRVTVCELTLRNGFTVRGESAVVFIENNVPETGRQVARTNAVNQIWQLLGFRLREQHAAQMSCSAQASITRP